MYCGMPKGSSDSNIKKSGQSIGQLFTQSVTRKFFCYTSATSKKLCGYFINNFAENISYEIVFHNSLNIFIITLLCTAKETYLEQTLFIASARRVLILSIC